jgi:hypothetical protein
MPCKARVGKGVVADFHLLAMRGNRAVDKSQPNPLIAALARPYHVPGWRNW